MVGIHHQAPANRIPLGPKTARQRLVHHDRGRRLAGVRVGEYAPRHQRNPHRSEVGARDRSQQTHGPLLGRRRGAAIHGEIRSDSQPRQRQPIYGAYIANSRQRRDTVRHLLEEGDPPVRRRIPAARQRQAQGQQARGLEPRVGRAQPHKAANQQPRADQHHHRQRHFRDHQRIAHHAPGAPGGAAAAAFSQRRVEIGARASNRRRDAEQNAGGNRHSQRKQKQTGVDSRFRQPWNAGRPKPRQQRYYAARQHHPQRSARQRQQHALGEQLRHNPAAARAQRGAYGDLLVTSGASRQHQIGHIHAGHQQQKPHRRHQYQQRLTHVAHQFLPKRKQGWAPASVQRRTGLFQPARDDVQFGLRPVDLDARVQSPNGIQTSTAEPITEKPAGSTPTTV